MLAVTHPYVERLYTESSYFVGVASETAVCPVLNFKLDNFKLVLNGEPYMVFKFKFLMKLKNFYSKKAKDVLLKIFEKLIYHVKLHFKMKRQY